MIVHKKKWLLQNATAIETNSKKLLIQKFCSYYSLITADFCKTSPEERNITL